MIYLDNAATTGHKPIYVINSVYNAMKNYNANPGRSGHDLSVKAAEEVYNCRKTISDLFNNASENNVCFTQNCTHAINTVLNGVLDKGDHFIISSFEHNAVLRPSYKLLKEKNIRYDIAEVNLLNDKITLSNIEKLIKSNTKLIFVTAASNVVGRKLPLKEIGEICKNRNILFGVDAAQAAGVMEIDMQKMNIDFLCVAPHKGLYAPMGTGILVAQKPIKSVLITGGTGVNSADPFQPEDLPERIESGTLNVPGILGIKSGVEFILNKGVRKIEKYEMGMIQRLHKELSKLGAKLYTQYPEQKFFVPVLSFNLAGYHSEKIGDYLNKNGIAVRSGLHCSPLAHKQLGTLEKGTVRVSPSVFNNPNEIDRLIFLIKRLI